jgi:hypothetical protein
MTMTFHINEALLIERALFVAAMILIFGLISIGGLYLLRRRMIPARSSASFLQDALPPGGKDEAEAIARFVERLNRSGWADLRVREPQTETHQEVAPSTRE